MWDLSIRKIPWNMGWSLFCLAMWEFTFFTAVHTVLCFLSVAKRALTRQQCYGHCQTMLAQCQDFFSFTFCHTPLLQMSRLAQDA